MADYAGTGGNFTSVTGFNAHFSGWAMTLNPTNVENTGFAEAGNRTYLPTAQMVQGSAVGTAGNGGTSYPSGLTGSTPAMGAYQGTVTLQAYTGATMSFPANVSALAINRAFDGKADYALSFISSGPLSGTF